MAEGRRRLSAPPLLVLVHVEVFDDALRAGGWISKQRVRAGSVLTFACGTERIRARVPSLRGKFALEPIRLERVRSS